MWDLELRRGKGAEDVDLDGTNMQMLTQGRRVCKSEQRALHHWKRRELSPDPSGTLVRERILNGT